MKPSMQKTNRLNILLVCLSALTACADVVVEDPADPFAGPESVFNQGGSSSSPYGDQNFGSTTEGGITNQEQQTQQNPAEDPYETTPEERPEVTPEELPEVNDESEGQGLGFEDRPLEQINQTTEFGPNIDWTGSFSQYGRLQVIGVHTNVTVRPSGDDSTVRVRATIRSDQGRLDQVRVEIIEHTWGITVCALYTDSGNVCSMTESNAFFAGFEEVYTDFDITIPSRMHTAIVTTYGDLSVTDVKRSVRAGTVWGDIDVISEDIVSAVSTHGDVNVKMNPRDFRQYQGFSNVTNDVGEPSTEDDGYSLSVGSVFGDVTLSLPRDTDAYFTGMTLLGEVQTDFSIGGEGTAIVRGPINNGGDLSIAAVTNQGNIRVNAY